MRLEGIFRAWFSVTVSLSHPLYCSSFLTPWNKLLLLRLVGLGWPPDDTCHLWPKPQIMYVRGALSLEDALSDGWTLRSGWPLKARNPLCGLGLSTRNNYPVLSPKTHGKTTDVGRYRLDLAHCPSRFLQFATTRIGHN